MNIKTLEQIIKNKSSKVEFAIVTNLKNGESQVFEPGQKLSGDFDKFQKDISKYNWEIKIYLIIILSIKSLYFFY